MNRSLKILSAILCSTLLSSTAFGVPAANNTMDESTCTSSSGTWTAGGTDVIPYCTFMKPDRKPAADQGTVAWDSTNNKFKCKNSRTWSWDSATGKGKCKAGGGSGSGMSGGNSGNGMSGGNGSGQQQQQQQTGQQQQQQASSSDPA